MDENTVLDIQLIKKRAVSGVVTFTIRTIFVRFFTIIATFILTILLDPQSFGIFFIVSAILNFFVYFSDVGLAAALVQKKSEPSQDDLKTTFTIQQLIVITLVILGLLLSRPIANFYNLDSQGLMLLRILIFSLLLSSLKTIPSILLERNLNFTRLVIPQVVENIVFYTTAVFLALNHFELASFTWAVLVRGLIGLVLIYYLSPWLPKIGINKQSSKQLMSFGIPFQLNSILGLTKDDLLTIFLGKVLSFSQLGYIGWGQKWALEPLRFFMDSVNKVAFPAYSRLQDHKDKLAKAIEKSLFFVTYLVYPSVFGMAAIAPYFISLVPRYSKWEPALPLLYLFAVNSIFSAVSTTFTNALFATGRQKIVLKLMVFWTSATWVLTYLFIAKYGYIGVGVASVLVSVSSLLTLYFIKKEMQISVSKNIFGPLILSILMFTIVRSLASVFADSFIGLIITIMAGAIIYLITSFAIFKKHLIEDASVIINSLIFKK